MGNRIFIINLFLGSLFFSHSLNYAQDLDRIFRSYNTHIFNSSFTKIGVDNWVAGGAMIAENKISTSALNNPAGLSVDKISFYAEFGKWSTSEWFADTKINGHYVIPGYISIELPLKKFAVSFGYMNYYQIQLRNKFEILTPKEPEGTGEFAEAKINIRLNTFFGSACYSPDERISFGVTSGLNYLIHNDKILNYNTKGDSFGLILIAGLVIKPFQNFSFAYNFRYLTNINYDVAVQSKDLLLDIDIDTSMIGNNERIKELKVESVPFTATFPLIFETGLRYLPLSNLSFHAKVEMQKWSTSSYYENRYVVNYHLGSKLSVLKWLSLGVGYFTQNETFGLINVDFNDQKFLTMGLRIQINKSFSISSCIMDSHILKEKDLEDKYYQTYFSAGISYSK